MRFRLIALVLLVIAAAAAGFVLTQVDSSRDAWLVFGTGLALAAVTGALALTTKRRSRAMREVERYFTLTPEMVFLAGFDGHWKRANPAVEAVLGYRELPRASACRRSAKMRSTNCVARSGSTRRCDQGEL